MAFYFLPKEPVAEGLRRIAGEQVAAGLADVKGSREDPVEAVHALRKRCKKLRGLLRLVREPLGGAFEQENVFFRDVARRLSSLRDSDAVLEAAEALRDSAPPKAHKLVHQFLCNRAVTSVGGGKRAFELLRVTGEELAFARKRVSSWRLRAEGFDALAPGLRRTYTQARKRMEEALEQPGTETFHEWRKRVKDHWYHARLLVAVGPKGTRERAEQCKVLSELLGDEHDLSVLQGLLEENADQFADEVFGPYRKAVKKRRKKLRRNAEELGLELFSGKPGKLVQRFEHSWNKKA